MAANPKPATIGSFAGYVNSWGQGDEAARDRLISLVQRELHQIARRCMAGERAGNSLQATALVNEAYLRLINAKDVIGLAFAGSIS